MSENDDNTTPAPEESPKSAPANGGAVALLSSANKLDLGIIGAGVVAFIASLLPYYTVSVSGFGGSSASAWNGFFGWFGALCALAAAGVLVARILGVSLPLPVRTTVLGLMAAALVCTLLALFITPGGGCDDAGVLGASVCDIVDQGHGFGYWLALLATLVGTALAALRRTAD